MWQEKCSIKSAEEKLRKTRGLEPPSSCSWKTKEVGAFNKCNSSRHIRKNILWFSLALGFLLLTHV
jgi:hypothetical protein